MESDRGLMHFTVHYPRMSTSTDNSQTIFFYQYDILQRVWHLLWDKDAAAHTRTYTRSLKIIFTLHYAKHEQSHQVWPTRNVQSLCAVWQVSGPPPPHISPQLPPAPPCASTCSPGDRYYLHGRGSAVNAMSKAPGHWQAKTECLEIEM